MYTYIIHIYIYIYTHIDVYMYVCICIAIDRGDTGGCSETPSSPKSRNAADTDMKAPLEACGFYSNNGVSMIPGFPGQLTTSTCIHGIT